MKKTELVQLVERLLVPFAEERGYEIVDVDYVKEGSNWYLRILGDKEGGFTLDDCVDTSHYLDDKLESEDPIETPYILEVSSPGLDRPLKKDKDFNRGIGKLMEVRLFKAAAEGVFAGQKEFVARLSACDHERQTVTFTDEAGAEAVFARSEFALVRPYIEW